mmetsp:Transcript_23852/g.32795  ORF Transcript_23852/g.32795 Transcript_23852/m.32795 type:complete len:103 (-) Transcript_23852:148-456(-)
MSLKSGGKYLPIVIDPNDVPISPDMDPRSPAIRLPQSQQEDAPRRSSRIEKQLSLKANQNGILSKRKSGNRRGLTKIQKYAKEIFAICTSPKDKVLEDNNQL